MKSYERADGFDDERGCGEMTRAVKVVRGVQKLSLLSLSALTSIGILRIQTTGCRAPPEALAFFCWAPPADESKRPVPLIFCR